MDEAIDENLIKFSRSTPDSKVKKFKRKSEKDFELEGYEVVSYQIVKLTEQEKQEVSNWLEIAYQKLNELGIPNINARLPDFEHLVFTRQIGQKEEDTVGGCSSSEKDYLRIDLLESSEIGDKDSKYAFFHELSHFITTTTLKYSKDNHLETVIEGFTRTGKGKKGGVFENFQVDLGLWEEWQADLFVAYCMDGDVFSTPYFREDAFGIALLKDYANKKEVDEITAFKRIFRARVTQDFNFQKKLTDVYGNGFMKLLNNVEIFPVFGRSPEKSIREVAEQGKFKDSYMNLLNKAREESISLNGMNSSLSS